VQLLPDSAAFTTTIKRPNNGENEGGVLHHLKGTSIAIFFFHISILSLAGQAGASSTTKKETLKQLFSVQNLFNFSLRQTFFGWFFLGNYGPNMRKRTLIILTIPDNPKFF